MVESQREMQRKEGEMTTPILQGMLDAVKRIASQEGYEMVLEKSAVPYFRGDLELTDRAIQLYNSGQPGGATPPAAPPARALRRPPLPRQGARRPRGARAQARSQEVISREAESVDRRSRLIHQRWSHGQSLSLTPSSF